MKEDMMQDIFKSLQEPRLELDIESVATTLTITVQHLAALHPEKQQVFAALAAQLQGQMNTLRAIRAEGLSLFSGRGVVANKLRQHINLMRWMYGPDHGDFHAKLAEVDNIFNHHPTTDDAKLQELNEFVKFTTPLIHGAMAGEIKYAELKPGQSLTDLNTGFYTHQSGALRRHLLVLRATLNESGLTVLYILASHDDETIMYLHPSEMAWYKSDGTYTFDQVTNRLKAELDQLLTPLGFSTVPVDLDVAMAVLTGKANYLFDKEDEIALPCDHFVKQADFSEVTLPMGNGICLVFTNTKGLYPQRSIVLLKKIGDSQQSVPFSGLNEVSRQHIFKRAFAQLDAIADSVSLPVAV